jgi:hypothetical protein
VEWETVMMHKIFFVVNEDVLVVVLMQNVMLVFKFVFGLMILVMIVIHTLLVLIDMTSNFLNAMKSKRKHLMINYLMMGNVLYIRMQVATWWELVKFVVQIH